MRLWNIGEKEVSQLYNSRMVVLKPNEMKEFSDDVAVFLLGKKPLRGQGLVQVKENDNKEDRYKEGRLNIYNWNKGICNDYEKHCEERESISLRKAPPHEAILVAQKVVAEYEKWVEDGSLIRDEIKETGEAKIYACPYCNKEFGVKVAYFGHLRSHQKEKPDVNLSTAGNKSKGEG